MSKRFPGFLTGLILSAFFAAAALAQEPTYPPARGPEDVGELPPVPGEEMTAPAAPADDDISVEARGPVHEAFARPTDMAPGPGPVVPKKPPGPIAELPPDQKPEGDVIWIRGYWAWDLDRKDFLWVSGVWRLPPPGRKWVPGAWAEVEGGWQWTPGFWAPATADEAQYLPQPPATLDFGPNSPAPNDDCFWTPGSWLYRNDSYAWQPGFWAACRPGWVWTPSSYCWTPRGWVFVNGFWDFPLAGRGLLFAPVGFNRPLWQTAGWAYRPSYVVPAASLVNSLFVGPGARGYYFGNYYGAGFRDLGFRPWFASSHNNTLFSYYRWQNQGNAAWLSGLRSTYAGRFNGSLPVPANTFAQQQRLLARGAVGVRELQTVHSLSQVQGISRLSQAEARHFQAHASQLHEFARTRATAPAGRSHAPLPQANLSHPIRPAGFDRGPALHAESSRLRSGIHVPSPGLRINPSMHTPGNPGRLPAAGSIPRSFSPPAVHRSAPTYHAPAYRAPAPSYRPAPAFRAPAPRPAPSYHPAPAHSSGRRR